MMCILRNSEPYHLIPSRVLSEFYLFTNWCTRELS